MTMGLRDGSLPKIASRLWGLVVCAAAGGLCESCSTRPVTFGPDGSVGGGSPVDAEVFAITLPEGGRCGPATTTADPRLPAGDSGVWTDGDGGGSDDGGTEWAGAGSDGVDDGGAWTDSDAVGSDDGGAEEYSPVRPLGIGYPDGDNPLPAHIAYLTFDDGPSDWTNDFLDILRSHGIQATFFVTAMQLKGPLGLDGTYVDEYGQTEIYRDLVKRELDEGHVVGNHTVNHPDLAGIDAQQIESELDENELLINVALLRAGSTPQVLSLFRPPFGSPWFQGQVVPADPASAQAVAAQRIVTHGLNVMWTIDSTDSLDWAQGESYSRTIMQTPTPGAPTFEAKEARIVQAVLGDSSVAQGAGIIVLMHDTHDTTLDVLPQLIEGLIGAGYSFDTIEHYAEWRWNRPSIDLTPGPGLYQACLADRDWGCASFGVTVGTDRSREVCGRMWTAYQALGGAAVLGAPTAAPIQSLTTGIVSQAFEHAVVELHPENPAPCNIVAISQ
ncbi:MAG TPA: polysaccharide deacetylase family protein [Polyangiaceae bacterium]|nr:polysaccharide deacetylase family protein [Polyangiaceae bacterium]